MGSFIGDLVVTPIGDTINWKLVKPLTYQSSSGDLYKIPKGFTTDFASTPKWMWCIIHPYGRYGKATVLHDYLYQTAVLPRDKADLLFKEAMESLSVAPWKIQLLYLGVRLFGKSHYKG